MEKKVSFESITPEWIRRKLSDTGISQNELAEFIGTNPQRLSEWLSGRIRMLDTTKAAVYYFFKTKRKPRNERRTVN